MAGTSNHLNGYILELTSHEGGESLNRKDIPKTAEVVHKVAAGLFCLETGTGISRANVYFVQTGTSWVLIDAGLTDSGPMIRETAESIFGVGNPPHCILLTHDHPDHSGSARELAQFWSVNVYVHPDEMPLTSLHDLTSIQKYANPLDRWIILPILRLMPKERVHEILSSSRIDDIVKSLDPNSPPPGLPEWVCIHTPGHTPGHIVFFRPSDRVLITGDAVVTVDLNSLWGFLLWAMRVNRQKISGPPWYSTLDRKAARESYDILARLEPEVIASGHGPVVSDKGRTRF